MEAFQYRAYGVGITSPVYLPGLWSAPAAPDVVIRLEPFTEINETRVSVEAGVTVLSLAEEAAFELRNGREIVVQPARGVSLERIQELLGGVVLGLLLQQRGQLVLHASSVVVGNEIVAFAGESGWGKSSIAAGLALRGYPMAADDLTPVDLSGPIPMARPGHIQLKLRPHVAEALSLDWESLASLPSDTEKRGCIPLTAPPDCSKPLRCIYVLSREESAPVRRIRAHEAFNDLLCHTYPSRLNQTGGQRHFLQCAKLAASVPLYRLRTFEAQQDLPRVIHFLESHFAQNTQQ